MDDYDLKPQDPKPPEPAPPAADPPVMSYRPAADEHRAMRQPASTVGPFLIGLVAALTVCAGGFLLMGYTFDASRPIRVLILLSALGCAAGLFLVRPVLQNRFGFAGFGRGVVVGLILGGIALVPCAGCYTLMLLE